MRRNVKACLDRQWRQYFSMDQALTKALEHKIDGTYTKMLCKALNVSWKMWAYGVVVSMFDFHRSDRVSNPGRGGKIS